MAGPGPYPPKSLLLCLRRLLILPERQIVRRILPIPPAPAVFDECVIDIGAIKQEHISKGAPLLVLAMGLEDGNSPEDK